MRINKSSKMTLVKVGVYMTPSQPMGSAGKWQWVEHDFKSSGQGSRGTSREGRGKATANSKAMPKEQLLPLSLTQATSNTNSGLRFFAQLPGAANVATATPAKGQTGANIATGGCVSLGRG